MVHNYQITAQTPVSYWVERHPTRIARLKLAIEQTDIKERKAAFQVEIDERLKHLTKLKKTIQAELAAIEELIA